MTNYLSHYSWNPAGSWNLENQVSNPSTWIWGVGTNTHPYFLSIEFKILREWGFFSWYIKIYYCLFTIKSFGLGLCLPPHRVKRETLARLTALKYTPGTSPRASVYQSQQPQLHYFLQWGSIALRHRGCGFSPLLHLLGPDTIPKGRLWCQPLRFPAVSFAGSTSTRADQTPFLSWVLLFLSHPALLVTGASWQSKDHDTRPSCQYPGLSIRA